MTLFRAGVQLSPWQPHWAVQAQQCLDALRAVLPQSACEHIGSTSVPGLCAKPVLDLLLGVDTLAQVDAAAVALLAARGYRYRPEHEAEIPDRRYFVRDASAAQPRVHLHAVVVGGVLWQRHLAFRDALRTDAALREAYAQLKRQLAEAHAGDKAAYQAAKGPFIRTVLGV